MAAVIVWFGCASSPDSVHMDPADGIREAQVPAFLTGPLSAILVSTNDFTARLVQTTGTNQYAVSASGNLFQQQGQLLFVPRPDENSRPDPWAGSFRFLWDTKANTGFIISERLHGYMPISASGRFRLASRQPGPFTQKLETLDGRNASFEEDVVQSDAGAAVAFRVWHSEDLGDVPLKISGVDAGGPNLTLTEVDAEALSPDLFIIPNDYSRYDDVETMTRELTRRPRIMPYSSTPEVRPRRR